jgi:hypothetical protein
MHVALISKNNDWLDYINLLNYINNFFFLLCSPIKRGMLSRMSNLSNMDNYIRILSLAFETAPYALRKLMLQYLNRNKITLSEMAQSEKLQNRIGNSEN